MSNKDILQLCFGNLLRRRTRTVLSVIGVIIGTTAIIVMLSIGFGLSYGFQEQLESFGNLHTIQVYSWGSGGGSGQDNKLDDRTIAKLEKIDGVSCISPQLSHYVILYGDHKKADANLVGMNSQMLELLGLTVEKGRMVNNGDKAGLLFGKAVAASFYDPRKQEYGSWGSMEPTVDPLAKFTITNDWQYGTNQQGQDMGETVLLEIEAQGIGLLANENDEFAYNVYSTIEFVEKITSEWEKAQNAGRPAGGQGKKTYNQVLIYAEDLDKIEAISTTIRDDYGFSTYSLNDMLKELQKTMLLIEGVLGGIGGISLLVAAIGIANTMIMSVYERTREISVMKVIGASLADIRKMFLLEAGMIGFGGGLIGIANSYGISFVMNNFLGGMVSAAIGGTGGRISVIPWWLTIAALAFATFIGVVSGYTPAQRAMNMSVLEGLKNE